MNTLFLRTILACSLLPALNALAVTYTWGGGTGNWTATNWNPGSVAGPTSGANDAVIGSGAVSLTSTVNYTGSTTVSGGSLDLSDTNGRIYSAFGWANQTVTVGSGGLLNLGGWGDGASGTSGGLGQLAFTAANLVVNGGTVRYSASTVDSGNQDRGFTIGASGATFEANGGANVFTLNQGRGFGITSASAGTLTLGGANNGTSSMVLGGTGGLTKTGAGTWTLTGINTHTGGTTVNQGVLDLNAQSGGTGAIRGAVTVNSGAELRSSGGGGAVFGYTAGQKIDTFTIIGGLINNATGVNHVWNATLNMTGGEMRTNGGVSSNSTGNFFEWGNTAVNTFASANTATLSGRIRVRADANANLTFTVADGAAATDLLVSAAITSQSGTTGLIKNGPGLLRLGGDNLYAGNTTINAGVLELAPGARMYNAGFNNTAVVTVNSGGTWRMPDYSYGGVGQLADYRQRRVLNGGAIEVTGNTHSSGQNFTVNALGGTFAYLPSGQTLSLVGNGNGNILTDGPLTFNSVGNITITEVVEGTGSLIKTGGGTLTLSQVNTYSGDTTVSVGTLKLGNATALGTTAGSTLIQSGATLDLGGVLAGVNSTEAISVQGSGVGGLGAIINTGAAIMNSGIGNLTLTGDTTLGGSNRWDIRSGITFTGNGYTLTKTGSFQMAVSSPLNGADIVLNAGRLTIQHADALGTGGTTTLNPGSTLDFYGAYTVPETLILNGGILASENNDTTFSGAMTVNTATTINTLAGGHDITISGAMGGTGDLLKTGPSTLTLNNPSSTRTGRTTVQQGTLVLAGASGNLGLGNPAATADAIVLGGVIAGPANSAGTLLVSGGDLNPGAGRGLTLAGSGGTLDIAATRTLNLAGTLNASAASTTLAKAGSGTFSLTGNAQINALQVNGGTYVQASGDTTVYTTSTGVSIAPSATYKLSGGVLRTDMIKVASGGTFEWGNAALTHYQTNANGNNLGAFSSTGYSEVRSGVTLRIEGSTATTNGATLELHNSPTLYLNGDVRFNNLLVTANLDLTSAGDSLEVEINPYLLRPYSPSLGSSAIEFGSLPLVIVSGNLTGTFDTFGTVLADSQGFTQYTGVFSSASALDDNTWFLEYAQNVNDPTGSISGQGAGVYDMIFFHYRVTGYVPEPGSFGLLAAGALGLRLARSLSEKRRKLEMGVTGL